MCCRILYLLQLWIEGYLQSLPHLVWIIAPGWFFPGQLNIKKDHTFGCEREREIYREGEHRLALSVGTMFCFLFLFFVMEFVTEVIGAQQRLMQQRPMCMFYLFNLYHPLCLKDMLAWTCAAHRHTHMWGKRDEPTNWITATKSLMLLYELFASPPPPTTTT